MRYSGGGTPFIITRSGLIMWIWDSGANLCVTRIQQNPTEPAARPSGTPTEPAADPPEPAAEAGTCRGPDQNPAGPTPAELGTCRARPESSRAHCGALQQSRGPSRSWPWAPPFFLQEALTHLCICVAGTQRNPPEPAAEPAAKMQQCRSHRHFLIPTLHPEPAGTRFGTRAFCRMS